MAAVAACFCLLAELLVFATKVWVGCPGPGLVVEDAVDEASVPFYHIMAHITMHVIHLTPEIPRHLLTLVLLTILRRMYMHRHRHHHLALAEPCLVLLKHELVCVKTSLFEAILFVHNPHDPQKLLISSQLTTILLQVHLRVVQLTSIRHLILFNRLNTCAFGREKSCISPMH